MEHLQAREIVSTHFKMREDFKFTRSTKKSEGKRAPRPSGSTSSSVPRSIKGRTSAANDGVLMQQISTKVDVKRKGSSGKSQLRQRESSAI